MGQIEFTKNYLGDDFDTRFFSDLWRLERHKNSANLILSLFALGAANRDEFKKLGIAITR
jgi:hypothetical protein